MGASGTSRSAGTRRPTEASLSARARAIVWREGHEPAWLAERTRRALRQAGLETAAARGREALRAELAAHAGPAWLVRAGAWPVSSRFEPPPSSATGRPLLGLGAVVGGTEAPSWRRTGHLEREPLPPVYSVWLEPRLAAALPGLLDQDVGLALERLREAGRPRVVRVAQLDVAHDARLRVAEVVTSLQQGGAERVALDLAAALPRHGVAALLAVVGAPTRQSFALPPQVTVLERSRERCGACRIAPLGADLVAHGIDVAHAHLLDADDLRRLGETGVAVAVTLHNQRPGWPTGTSALRAGEVDLLVACSLAVERDVAAAGVDVPSRTVWNGIDFARVAGDTGRDGPDWRRQLGLAPEDFVLLAVANPRPQKRLERLPPVLHELRARLAARGSRRAARLIVAGSPSAGNAQAELAQAELASAVGRLGLEEHVRLVGSVADVGPLLRAADVLVSASAHEGLSLAQLEALACDTPVVTTDVGGAAEVATRVAGVRLVPSDAAARDFVPQLLEIADARERPPVAHGAARHFGLSRMAADYARLLRSVVRARGAARGEGLLLVANNFSTGGAQSSARRLLLELRRRGVRVRAAVLQEQPGHPTPGRRALEAAGVPVLAVPPPADLEPAAAVARVAEWMEPDPPEAVVLWNVIAQHKVLLADTLFDVPVYDVSPGEMYFESLERYFASPRPGLPYGTLAEYGARLAGVIVKYAAEAAAARALGAPVHVIPNGIAVLDPPPRRPAEDRLVIGTLARLDPRKHVDRLLRALRLAAPRLPPHVLRIAGGPDPGARGHAAELMRLADGLCVEFVGEEDASSFLPGLDLFALVAEPAGCPNASLEAMAFGVPVVATDAGGMSEQIEDGASGRLVPREDEPALADALVALCADAALRERLGEAGRARVRERFSLQAMANAYATVLLGSRARAGAGVGECSPEADSAVR